MKAITLKIVKCDNLLDLQKKYSSIVHFAYNRFKDGLKEKEVRSKYNEIFKSLGSWFIQCAIKEASQIYSRHKEKKVIFGGKSNFIRYVKGLLTKEEYRNNKLHPIIIQGEKLQLVIAHLILTLMKTSLLTNLIRMSTTELNFLNLKRIG